MKINCETHLCLSIIATGKCNCSCDYCHFYASNDRNLYNRDIDSSLFERYLEYIKYLKTITPNITCRLSGGEPLFMGDKVFSLTDRIKEVTGLSTYIMTNGKLLSRDVISKAKDHNISAFVVSVENPFSIAKGAVSPEDTISKFVELQNTDVPLYFGMLVLENSQFRNIKKLADYFYERTGTIPPMCEVNFLPYQSPTEDEMHELYFNVKELIKNYNGKAPISLFPYIIPEYYSGNLDFVEYLTELPIDDKFNSLNLSNEEFLQCTEKQLDRSYFSFECEDTACEWRDSCKRLKWVWQMKPSSAKTYNKIQDYCRFKKVLSNAFYDALTEN